MGGRVTEPNHELAGRRPRGPGFVRHLPALGAYQLPDDEPAEAGAARGRAGGEPVEQAGPHRGGHALHTRLAAKLLEERDAWQLVEMPAPDRHVPVGLPAGVRV